MKQIDVQERIIASFHTRSRSYFEDNYGHSKDPNRRRRLAFVQSWLKQNVRPGMKILEVGAGPAVLSESLRDLAASYTAVDLSWDNLRVGRNRVIDLAAVVANATKLPLHDACFDGIISLGCLEYIPQMRQAICEFGRVVRPHGFIVASFANAASPARWWNEMIILPLSDLKKKAVSEEPPRYPRFLTTTSAVQRHFDLARLNVEELEFLNPGFLGYPFSSMQMLQRIETRLHRKAALLRRTCSEFLILARKCE